MMDKFPLDIMQKNILLARPEDNKNPDRAVKELEAVAEQFEALLVEKMFAAGRASKLAEDPMGNKATDTFNSLLDREYAISAADQGSFGIAEALVAQFRHHVQASGDR